MKDSGHPAVSGTNTLTIVIGDVNDNKHYIGHKDIYVYSYLGEWHLSLYSCSTGSSVPPAYSKFWPRCSPQMQRCIFWF